MNSLFYIAPLALLAGGAVYGLRLRSTDKPMSPQIQSPVIVELFTSEGCSDCPPADELLAKLANGNPLIIPLEEHVDYWNHLGWADQFSSAAVSARQNGYSQSLNVDGVYTPQMVVDGQSQFVGSDRAQAERAIGSAAIQPKANVKLGYSSPNLSVTIAGAPRGCEVWLAVTEDGLRSKVSKGENNGLLLVHRSVVRSLRKIASVTGSSYSAQIPVTLDKDWNAANLHLVVFLQETGQGAILGSAITPAR